MSAVLLTHERHVVKDGKRHDLSLSNVDVEECVSLSGSWQIVLRLPEKKKRGAMSKKASLVCRGADRSAEGSLCWYGSGKKEQNCGRRNIYSLAGGYDGGRSCRLIHQVSPCNFREPWNSPSI